MNRNFPVPGQIYKHFKGSLYQIITIAKDSETLNDMVVYQALYGDFKSYVRPLDMFMSEIDKVKYPAAYGTYRFELINPHTLNHCTSPSTIKTTEVLEETDIEKPHGEESNNQRNISNEINPILLDFLDASDYHEKLEIYITSKDELDEKALNSIASSMDINLEGNSLNENYYTILKSLETQVKYEIKSR